MTMSVLLAETKGVGPDQGTQRFGTVEARHVDV